MVVSIQQRQRALEGIDVNMDKCQDSSPLWFSVMVVEGLDVLAFLPTIICYCCYRIR